MTETNMSRERAESTAEALASMRCRGGDSSARDQLLRALFELTDGAYVNKRTSAFCRERVAVIERLLPKVPPRDADDGQVRGGGQALFHTGAACYARAGDCGAARAHYGKHFPTAVQGAIRADQLQGIIDQSFTSSIERCATPP